MVSFDLSFKSMCIEDIVEDEGEIWTEEGISWLGSTLHSRIFDYFETQKWVCTLHL